MNNSRIKIKFGNIDIEFEGSEEFIRSELLTLLEAITELQSNDLSIVPDDNNGSLSPSVSQTKNWGISTYSAKLKVKSGTDLVIAACAFLTFESGQGAFTRKAILDEMKSATSYYQVNYSKNLTRYISQLVKNGDLVVTSAKLFALGANTRKMLEQRLAE